MTSVPPAGPGPGGQSSGDLPVPVTSPRGTGLPATTSPNGGRPAEQSNGDRPTTFVATPNVEKYMLEADALRRRQLRSALLYGSSRTWRDRRRIWPGVVVGVIVVAVLVAAIAVAGAFRKQKEFNDKQNQQRQPPATSTAPAQPTGPRSPGR